MANKKVSFYKKTIRFCPFCRKNTWHIREVFETFFPPAIYKSGPWKCNEHCEEVSNAKSNS
jgi:hypothetical protein